MRAMKEQNANMAILQKRAEMAEKQATSVELAEMRENLADQVFASSIPGAPVPVIGAHVDVPFFHSSADPLNGPPTPAPTKITAPSCADAQPPKEMDLGPALDGADQFIPVHGSGNDLAGQLGRAMGWGPGVGAAPAAAASERRRDSARMTTSAPSRATRRSSTRGRRSSARRFSNPARRFSQARGRSVPRRPWDRRGPRFLRRTRSGVYPSRSTGDGAPAAGGAPFGDDYEASGLRTRDTDAEETRRGVSEERGEAGGARDRSERRWRGRRGGSRGYGSAESLHFLQGEPSEDAGGDDEPPTLVEGEFDHPAAGMNVEGAEDEDFDWEGRGRR